MMVEIAGACWYPICREMGTAAASVTALWISHDEKRIRSPEKALRNRLFLYLREK